MESQTQIKNIIGTDHKKIEMLVSSLEDTLNDKTAWIMICLILFEFFFFDDNVRHMDRFYVQTNKETTI